jgi:hypothetical protein
MSNLAIESLTAKRTQLVEERQKAIDRFDYEIAELDEAIEIVSGRKAKEVISETAYDDESREYIRNTEDGI